MAFINLKEYYVDAQKELKAGKFKEAFQKFNYLINLYPDDPYVLFGLGTCYSKMEQWGMSIVFYMRSLEIDSQCSEAWNNVGGMYRKLNRIEEARMCFENCLKLAETEKHKKERPDGQWKKTVANYYGNMGSSYVSDHNHEIAFKYFDKAMEYDPECKNAKWNRSLVNLEIGNYEKGFEEYEYGDRLDENKIRNYMQEKEIKWWDGSDGNVLAIYGEQGIGDEILWMSMMPELIQSQQKVIVDAHPRLYTMFRRAFPEADIYGTRKQQILAWLPNYEVTAQMAMGSIAKHLRKKKEDFLAHNKPYLFADETLKPKVMKYLEPLSNKKKVGVSWKGGTQGSSKINRCFELDKFADVMRAFPDVAFISLQYQPHTVEEVDKFNEKNQDIYLYHWKPLIDDYDLTMALVNELDLIVSVPQSVVHLAGAMGARVYQLCPYKHLWQMGVYGEDMPWYSNVKNIWQPEHMDWNHCLKKSIELMEKELPCLSPLSIKS